MEAILKLLRRYKFDFGDRSLTLISIQWRNYDPNWLRLAVTESLFRGRYKVISVEQILETWQRKQEVSYKFDDEFASLVWGNAIGSEQIDPDIPLISDNAQTMIEKLKSLCK